MQKITTTPTTDSSLLGTLAADLVELARKMGVTEVHDIGGPGVSGWTVTIRPFETA